MGRYGLDEAHTLDELNEAPRLSYSLDEACLLGFPRRELTDDESDAAVERAGARHRSESTGSTRPQRPTVG